MRSLLLLPSLTLLVFAVHADRQTRQTNADILEELQTVKKIQRNMKRRLESDLAELQTNVSALQESQPSFETATQNIKSELQAEIAELESHVTALSQSGTGSGGGSDFIRWGRTTCPDTASLVYSGIVGGKHYSHAGGATNALCMTREPQFDDTPKPTYFGYVYGAEYEYIGDLHDQDVPCSVCLASQSATIMVPGTQTCPAGWTAQYSGYLVSEYYGRTGTEYLCLDGEAESIEGSQSNVNGFLLYHVLAKCGSLLCPPYEDNAVVTCVVCSK